MNPLQNWGNQLYVGIYGVSEDGARITPTIYAKGPKIKKGADPSGDESTDPTLPVWAQLDLRVANLEENGADGYTPEKGVDYYTDEDKTEMVDAVLAAIPQAADITVVKADDTITLTTTLEDGSTSTSVVTLDSSGYPSTVVTDGVECPVSWDGFDDVAVAVWEGGSY